MTCAWNYTSVGLCFQHQPAVQYNTAISDNCIFSVEAGNSRCCWNLALFVSLSFFHVLQVKCSKHVSTYPIRACLVYPSTVRCRFASRKPQAKRGAAHAANCYRSGELIAIDRPGLSVTPRQFTVLHGAIWCHMKVDLRPFLAVDHRVCQVCS